MGANSREIERIVEANDGLIRRRDHPELVDAINWLVRRGDLVAVLPGVYAPADRVREREVRLRAAVLTAPDAVLTGAAAASVSFWPGIAVQEITLATPKGRRLTGRGFSWATRTIPVELIEQQRGLRYTTPELTALDLCSTVGGDGIDTALRARAATLTGMHEALALTSGRDGNYERRRLLLDSRDEPWSAAERLCHRLLRQAGITGWRANVAVPAAGSVYYLDVAFEAEQVALEIDGRIHEADRTLFESDRWRQNQLVLQGWTVLRFTWLMLSQHPELVLQTVDRALNPLLSDQIVSPSARERKFRGPR